MVNTRQSSHRESNASVEPATTRREASISPSEDTNTPQEETLAEKHARLTALLQQKRQLAEIEEMERELADLDPLPLSASAAPTGLKRAAAAMHDPQSQRVPTFRPATPPSFEGKTVKELSDYEDGWRVYFDAIQTQDETQRIRQAASYLKSYARDAWVRREEDPVTWDEYIRCLRHMVIDPANRLGYATLRLKEAKQKEGQSVRDFVKYIEELEKDIPKWDINKQKAYDLLNGLRPRVRVEVIRENKEITSRHQVIAAAQRQEELLSQQSRERSYIKPPERRQYSAPKKQEQRREQDSAKDKSKENKRSKSKDKTGQCFNCGKRGHWANECRAPKNPQRSTRDAPRQESGK